METKEKEKKGIYTISSLSHGKALFHKCLALEIVLLIVENPSCTRKLLRINARVIVTAAVVVEQEFST